MKSLQVSAVVIIGTVPRANSEVAFPSSCFKYSHRKVAENSQIVYFCWKDLLQVGDKNFLQRTTAFLQDKELILVPDFSIPKAQVSDFLLQLSTIHFQYTSKDIYY